MPKSRHRYARAQARARYRKPRRRGRSLGWNVGIAAVAILGIALLVWTVAGRRSEAQAAPRAGDPATGAPGDHWHASLDVNVCGQWLSPAPAFDTEAGNPQVRVGIHSHADGLIHIHPFNSSESGNHATLGRFLTYGGWSASADAIDLWQGPDGKAVKEKNGDTCKQQDGTKKKATITWYVNDKKQSGNPSDYHPKDHDRIVLLFNPVATKLDALGTPPNQAALPTPVDEQPFSPSTSTPGQSTPAAPSAPPSS